MDQPCIFTDFLRELGVPHTDRYSRKAFDSMPFHSLFGLSKLLQSYNIPSEAYEFADPATVLDTLPVPFMARTADSFVIVRSVKPGGDVEIVDISHPQGYGMSRDSFLKMWKGIAFFAHPHAGSSEPAYRQHRMLDFIMSAKRWVLIAAVAFIAAYLFISNGIYSHPSLIALAAVFGIGIYITYHLELKSLNIHSATGDDICGLIDRTGCHSVLSTSASSFFGIFTWSDVGIAYFSVSLACLLIFPQYVSYLALINACCCPFSFWSVWYQKYRAKAWCTLCLITQACLWTALACFIAGGWFDDVFPIRIEFYVLAASHVAVLLGVNAITPYFDQNSQKNENDTSN